MTEPATSPVSADFNPLSAAHIADPHPDYALARSAQPVFFLPDFGMWVATKHEHVLKMMLDHATFSNQGMIHVPSVPEAFESELAAYPVAVQMVAMDPPEHLRIKRTVQRAFGPAAARAAEPAVRQSAHDCIDRFVSDGRVELVAHYCEPIPMTAAARMLGAGTDSLDTLRQWAADAIALMVGTIDNEQLMDLTPRMLELDRYVRSLIAERRQTPSSDLLSSLVNDHEDDEDPLSEEELIGVVVAILAGGTDTTGGLIARMVHMALSDEKLLAELRSDPSLASNMVEESLRHNSSSRGIFRTTTRDVELSGVTVPAGSLIFGSTLSANRDEDVFGDAASIDVHRRADELRQHLGLGRGAHRCLGAHFATMEARIALEVLLERLPQMRLTDSTAPLDIAPEMMVAGIRSLQITW